MNWLDMLANGLAFILGVLGGHELAKMLLGKIFNWIQAKLGKPTIYVMMGAVLATLLWVKHLQAEEKKEAEQQRQDERAKDQRQAKLNLDAALEKERKAAEEREAQTPIYHGTLRPAKDRIRGVPPGTLVISLGTKTPLSPIVPRADVVHVLKCGAKDLITVGVENDRAWFSTQVVDSKGKPLARILKNDVQAYQGRKFYVKKGEDDNDPSEYIIKDSEGVTVFNARFRNRHVIAITGRFLLPGGNFLIVDQNGVRDPSTGLDLRGFAVRTIHAVATPFDVCAQPQ